MRLFSFLFTLLLLATCFTECKKSKDNNATPVADTPYIYGYLQATVQNEEDSPGIFITIENADAFFYSDSVSKALISPGVVSVNGDTLINPTSENFQTYNFANGVSWNVIGAGSIPSISYNLPGSFPDYLATIPDTIFVVNGVSFDVNLANTNNADSVSIVLQSGARGEFAGTYSTSQGVVTITSSILAYSFSPAGGYSWSPYSANIEIISWKYDYVILNGKKYEFIRNKIIVRNICII